MQCLVHSEHPITSGYECNNDVDDGGGNADVSIPLCFFSLPQIFLPFSLSLLKLLWIIFSRKTSLCPLGCPPTCFHGLLCSFLSLHIQQIIGYWYLLIEWSQFLGCPISLVCLGLSVFSTDSPGSQQILQF